MAVALLLTGTLLLGLLGIGGLVFYRFFAGPVEVAMPLPLDTPTSVPMELATPTPAALPMATPPSFVPTATLVIPLVTVTQSVEGSESASGQDGPGMSSPVSESSEMPQSGLGPLETLGIGFALVGLLGGARMARRMWMDRRA
jgi:hypothetical protein